jgi:hypothetical protein
MATRSPAKNGETNVFFPYRPPVQTLGGRLPSTQENEIAISSTPRSFLKKKSLSFLAPGRASAGIYLSLLFICLYCLSLLRGGLMLAIRLVLPLFCFPV